jgi:hypothetical protein
MGALGADGRRDGPAAGDGVTPMAAPWDDEVTADNAAAVAALRREEQRREELLRAEALRLMDAKRLATFAEALEMVRNRGGM